MQWHQPGPVGELVVEGPCQFIGLLLDGRAIITRSSVLFSGAAFSFLTSHLNLLQLLLLSQLLLAPQGTEHQRWLALNRRSDQSQKKKQEMKDLQKDV